MGKYRAADQDVIVVEDGAVQSDGHSFAKQSAADRRDFLSRNYPQRGERARIAAIMVEDGYRSRQPVHHLAPRMAGKLSVAHG